MPTFLVTGAAGFIGFKTSQLLLEAGHQVVGIDNLNDAYDIQLKNWRLQQLQKFPRFEWNHADICDRDALNSIAARWPQGETPAALLNLAARAGVRYSVENPWIYYETNALGTLNLLELCRQNEIPKVVLASTSSLYGQSEIAQFHENLPSDRPLSPYAASKKAAETLAFTYHHLHKLDVTIFRYFTVYGPAGRPDMSPLRFVQWIFEGRPVKVFGDGNQSRDFTFVDDIARGTIAGIAPQGYEIFNLGSDTPFPLIEMIRKLEKLIGREAKLEFSPAHAADMSATWADVSKTREKLNWQAEIGFDEGLGRLVEWYRQNRDWAKTIRTSD